MELDHICICVLPFFCLLKTRCTLPMLLYGGVVCIRLGSEPPVAPWPSGLRVLMGTTLMWALPKVPWDLVLRREAAARTASVLAVETWPSSSLWGSRERQACGGTNARRRWELGSSDPPPAEASSTSARLASEEGFVPRHPGPSPGPPCAGPGEGRLWRAGQAAAGGRCWCRWPGRVFPPGCPGPSGGAAPVAVVAHGGL